MSHAAHNTAHDPHDDNHEGAHHVSSVRTLVGVFIALLVLTVFTVYTAMTTDFGAMGDLLLALFIATAKATMVCMYFMHLRHDNSFYSVILISCVGALFLFLGLTMLDLGNRSNIDPIRAQHRTPVPADMVGIARFGTEGAKADGRALFNANCAACHGADARGVPGLGENLVGEEFVMSLSDKELAEFIIKGRDSNDPLSETGVPMPARGGNPNLSNEQVDLIVAYIRAIQPKDAHGKGHH